MHRFPILKEIRVLQNIFPDKPDTFLGLFRGLKKTVWLLQGEDLTVPVGSLISNYREGLRSLPIDHGLAGIVLSVPRAFATPRNSRRAPDSTSSERADQR